MTTRGWWLVGLNFLLPGSAQVLAGNRRLGRFGLGATLAMWLMIVLGILTAVLWRPALVTLATNWFFLLVAQGVLIAYAVLWIVLTVDTLRLVRLVRTGRGARVGIAGLAVALLVVASGGAAYAAQLAGTTRDTLGSIFGRAGHPCPLPTATTTSCCWAPTAARAATPCGSTASRWSRSTPRPAPSRSPASRATCRTCRSPRTAPCCPSTPTGTPARPSATCGWTSAINQLNTELEVCRDGSEFYPDAVANGSTPGVEATKDAAEGVLGIEIPYYVFLDMKGFADLVDALGGVDVTVEQRLPEGGGPAYEGQPAEEWASGWIEAGAQHMDGDTAQWFARSRYTTSDWDRMKRQRQLQEAILEAVHADERPHPLQPGRGGGRRPRQDRSAAVDAPVLRRARAEGEGAAGHHDRADARRRGRRPGPRLRVRPAARAAGAAPADPHPRRRADVVATLRVVLDQLAAPAEPDLEMVSRELTRALIISAPQGCEVEGIIPGVSSGRVDEVAAELSGIARLHKVALRADASCRRPCSSGSPPESAAA